MRRQARRPPMSAEESALVLFAGQIVLADWRWRCLAQGAEQAKAGGGRRGRWAVRPALPECHSRAAYRGWYLRYSRIVGRHRTDRGERLHQGMLGSLPHGRRNVEDSAMSNILQGHAASTGPNPPTDRFCLGLWRVEAFDGLDSTPSKTTLHKALANRAYGSPNVAIRSMPQKNSTRFSSILGSRSPYGPGWPVYLVHILSVCRVT